MITIDKDKSYRVTLRDELYDYEAYKTRFTWRQSDDAFHAGIYDIDEFAPTPPKAVSEFVAWLEPGTLLEPPSNSDAAYKIMGVSYQALVPRTAGTTEVDWSHGGIGNGSGTTKPEGRESHAWFQALLVERVSDGKKCFIWTVYADKDFIELVAVPVAPVDTKVTIVGGSTTYAVAVVDGGKLVELKTEVKPGVPGGTENGTGAGWGSGGGSASEPAEPELNLSLAEFVPDMIVEYHQGTSPHTSGLTPKTDPAVLLRSNRERNDPTYAYWPLGYRGWVILGFTRGFPAGKNWSIKLFEGGKEGQWVDVWVAKSLDPVTSVRYLSPSQASARPAYRFGFDYPTWHSGDVTMYNPSIRPKNPMSWDPDGRWTFACSVEGKGGTYPQPSGWSECSLEDVPAGLYYYMMIQDSGKQFGNESELTQYGADAYEVKVVGRSDTSPREAYYYLALDASGSAQSQDSSGSATDSAYYKTIKALVARIAEHNSGDTAFDKNLPVKRFLHVRLITSVKETPLSILRPPDSPQDYFEFTATNPAAATDEATRVSNDLIRQWKFQGNTPLVEVLPATEAAIQAKKAEVAAAGRRADFFFVLLTDGIPDPSGKYPTSAEANAKQSEINLEINNPVKDALIRVANLVKAGQALVIGAWAAPWVKTAYSNLKREDGKPIFKSVDIDAYSNEVHVGDSIVTASPNPIRHGEKFHTDCTGGDSITRRVGKNAAKLLARDPDPGTNVFGTPYLTMPYVPEKGLTEDLSEYSAVFDRREPAIYRQKNNQLWIKDGESGDSLYVWNKGTNRFVRK